MKKVLKTIDKTGEYLTDLPMLHQVVIGGVLLLISYGLLLAIIYKPLL